ncbi:MAG: hypothetical protein PHF84_06410 [bacterium]|nr:hypothetical protein [bacterium]
MDNEIYFNKAIMGIGKKEDNPGFDIPDIPRCPEGIRVLSMKQDKEGLGPLKHVTYKTLKPVPALKDFYLSIMPEKGWKYKTIINKGDSVILVYIKKRMRCQIMIMYNPQIGKNVVLIGIFKQLV